MALIQPSTLVLVRHTGLDASDLQTLGVDLSREVDLLNRARATRAVLAEDLRAQLHSRVPTLSRDGRRAAIRAQRRLFNAEDPTDSDMDTLCRNVLDMSSWRDARAAEGDAERRIEAAYQQAVISDLDVLRAALLTDGVARAVAIDAPHLYNEAAAAVASGAPVQTMSARLRRSVYLFVTRAGFKTSPRSSFGPVRVLGLEPAQVRACRPPIALIDDIATAFAIESERVDLLTWRGPTQVGADSSTAVIWESASHGGLHWRSETTVTTGGSVPAELVTTDGWLTRDQLAAWLGDAACTVNRARRLIDIGVLTPATSDPYATSNDPQVRLLTSLSDDLPDLEAPERAERVIDCAAALGAAGTPVTSASTLVYEDCAVTDSASQPDFAHLDRYAEAHARDYYLSRQWDVIAAYLTDLNRHVPGLTLPAQLRTLAADPRFNRDLQHAKTSDLRDDPADQRCHTALAEATDLPPLAFSLVAQRSYIGDSSFVLNQVGDGYGGLLARYGALFPQGALADKISGWLRVLSGHEPRTFVVSSEVTQAQRECLDTMGGLAWAGERVCDDESWDNIRIDINPEELTCRFTQPSGGRIYLAYVGLVPRHFLTGAPGLLAQLAHPWIDRSAFTRANSPYRVFQLTPGQDPLVFDRVIEHGVVTQRRTWYFRPDTLPLAASSGSHRLTDLMAWRRDLGIPDDCFVRFWRPDPFDADGRKPVWIRWSSPVATDVAARLTQSSRLVEVTEALPARPGCDRSEFVRLYGAAR